MTIIDTIDRRLPRFQYGPRTVRTPDQLLADSLNILRLPDVDLETLEAAVEVVDMVLMASALTGYWTVLMSHALFGDLAYCETCGHSNDGPCQIH